MCHLMRLGIYNCLLQILLFLLLTRPTLTLNVTKYFEIAAQHGCTCSYDKDFKTSISCPEMTIFVRKSPKINALYVEIECTSRDINKNYSLPRMDIGNCDAVEITQCHNFDKPTLHLLDDLGIKNVKHLVFTSSFGGNFNHLLTGISGLAELTLSFHKLITLPMDIFDRLENLTKLKLTYNALQQLPDGIFRNQLKLEELNLSHNRLNNLNKSVFEGATSLQVLDLSYNEIKRFQPDVFSLLPNLIRMGLSNNGLLELSSELFVNNKNINTLHKNGKTEHPQNIFDRLEKDTEPDLSNTDLKQLPQGIFRNQHKLEELVLSYNRLYNLSKTAFEGATSLQKLDLRFNAIDHFEFDVFSLLPNLSEIYLKGNNLSELPSQLFANNKHLTILHIDDKLELPQDIFYGLENITKLDLSINDFHQLPKGIFRNQHKLLELNLHGESLVILHKAFFKGATSLRKLNLNLEGLDPVVFSLLPNLREIDFSGDYLYNITSQLFTKNKNLTTLHIHTQNEIEMLPSDLLADLPHLQEVHIRSNNLGWGTDFNFPLGLSQKELQNKASLILISSAIREIPENLFINSINWTYISLFKNKLRTLPVKLFANQYNLHTLDLSYNELDLLQDGLFSDTISLSWLNLKYNQLIKLSGKIFLSLGKLEQLDLDSNKLNLLPVELFRNTRSLKSLHLRYNQLTQLSGKIFTPLFKLEELDLSNNNLSSLPNELFCKSTNLASIILSYNQLTEITAEIFSPLVKLKGLYLDNNRLNHMTIAKSRYSGLTHLALAGNLWDCDCANIPLMLFVERRSTITDYEKLFCDMPTNVTMHDYLVDNGLCQDDHRELVTLIGSILAVSLVISVIFAVYYKYETEVKVLMYRYPWLRRLVSEHDVDKNKKYDAFLSYSHKDQEFIGRILVPELEENGPIRFKLCVHVRDFIVGGRIPDQIAQAIDESRRTIFVLSKHFIESDWARLEFRLAHQAAQNEGHSRIIVIMYGDIGDIDSLDPLLRAYLRTNTYLEWGDPRFWNRLRNVMPHSVNALPVETYQGSSAV